jgi:hypothetical protein
MGSFPGARAPASREVLQYMKRQNGGHFAAGVGDAADDGKGFAKVV